MSTDLLKEFVTLPIELRLQICEWLSVRDILALRRTSKDMYEMTRDGTLWLSALKRLNLLLPVLPPTSKCSYGEIKPFMAEYLTLRSVYFHQNLAFRGFTGSLVCQETYDRILDIRVVPGAKFIVVLTEDLRGVVCSSIWELKLYRGGARIPLVKAKLAGKPELFEIAYGTVGNELHLCMAYADPAVQSDSSSRFITKVFVVGVRLELLEELADKNSFNAITEEKELTVLYETSIIGKVSQIAICDVQHTVLPNTLMIAIVCRPRLILCGYPELCSGTDPLSSLSLKAPEEVDSPETVWRIKLLPWQHCVLVSQLVGEGLQSVRFSLFHLPQVGQTLNDPSSVQTQHVHNVSTTSIYFSNLEEAWFSALRNPDKMLESQFHSAPPPVSIFIMRTGSISLIHLIMNPTAISDESISVRKGRVGKFEYKLPLKWVGKETMSFCDILPGAYFSLLQRNLDVDGPKEILGYRYQVRQYRLASATTTGAYIPEGTLEELDSTHPWDYPDLVFRPYSVSAFRMNHDFEGFTAIAFDESTGLLCYVDEDSQSQLRFLDFGGRFLDSINSS